ncbi:MAG: hypothetical protein ACXQTY_06565 [Candidatus Methanogasteraceae archaeon]
MLVTHQILTTVSDTVWDPFMMVLLIGTGIFLTFRLRGIQARKLVYTFRLMLERKEEDSGDISPFRALMTTFSGTFRHRQYRRCRNRNLTGRSGRDLLDVADRHTGNGDKVC